MESLYILTTTAELCFVLFVALMALITLLPLLKEVGCDFSLCGYLRCVIWVKMRVTFNIYSKKNNIGKVHMEGKKQGVHSYGINYLMFLLNLVICCRHFDHGIMILCCKWCSKLRNIFISLNGELKEEKEEALITRCLHKGGWRSNPSFFLPDHL